MLATSIPAKFNIPFANNAGAGYTRPIPQGSQIGIQIGAASLTDGFPPVTMNPGGWPFGQDFNGLLNQITAWNQWQATGGLASFDSVFSAAVGGYPRGALLSSSTPGWMWLNTTDNNTTNPDSSGTGWLLVPTSTHIQNQTFTGFNDTGSADAMVITPTPPCTAYATYQRWTIKKVASPNATTTPTLNVSGLGTKVLTNADGSALVAGALPANCLFDVEYNGTTFCIMSVTSPAAVIKGALFPYFRAVNNANFTATNLNVENPVVGGYATPVGDPTVIAGFAGATSTFTCPVGFDGLWYVQAYVNSLVSGSTSACGTRLRSNLQGLISVTSSLSGQIIQGSPSAMVNLVAGETVQLLVVPNPAAVLSYFYMIAIRFGRTS